MSTKLTQRGDTIVEVLLAILIVSLVLTTAYVTSNHSLKNSRQAQERGEALKFVEGQVEQIKAHTSLAAAQTDFCFDSSGVLVTPSSNSACTTGSVPGGYHIAVTQPAVNDGTYSVRVFWDSALGNGQDQVVMKYRIQN